VKVSSRVHLWATMMCRLRVALLALLLLTSRSTSLQPRPPVHPAKATTSTMAATSTHECPSVADPHVLDIILASAVPGFLSYTVPSERVVQANAEGMRVLARFSSTAPEKLEGGGRGGGSTRVTLPADYDEDGIGTAELFVKRVSAPSYSHKSWTDLRRTLVYLRTEARFYHEIVPLLVSSSEVKGESRLAEHLPEVYGTSCDLSGLIPEDHPTTDAKHPCPYDEGDDRARDDALRGRGGHIVLQSLGSGRYFQDSPVSLEGSRQCLVAAARLHASAWGDREVLARVADRLSDAGGSYQLRFRNPKELENMVSSWEHFLTQFGSGGGRATEVLGRESVRELGRRVYEMAKYVSDELSPAVDDEYATIVHGDYKSMNVFLPTNSDEPAIMIDFSCAGVGYGMSDLGMHIVHANLPSELDDGGEESLIESYLTALESMMSARTGREWVYPRKVAMRHYRLACVDYLRFIMGRFWRSATPESFEKKKYSKNTTLINRNLDAALRFIEKCDEYLAEFEGERRAAS